MREKIALKDLNKKLVESELNISNQWLFNFIDITHNIIDSKVNVNIKVVERWYVWPYPFLKFLNATSMSFGILYKIQISLTFLGSTMESFKLVQF